ncbi:MAG: IS1380 family transposase [Magnetococcales bacterium]|nr:IS1380 family transposase [Nitrospirota bacterium]
MANQKRSANEINRIEVTTDNITGRGGLVMFQRYLDKIKILTLLLTFFGDIKKTKKGIAITNMFKQVICWLIDGTCKSLVYFDELKKDEGYASAIETTTEDMATSHQIKRFFKSFAFGSGRIFRRILRILFVWRLKIVKPEVVEMTIDTMVMDNDEALNREGVQPTYKKVKGFQPLHMIWMGKIVDAIFRGGSKHGNHGNAVINMVRDAAEAIRSGYSMTVPIIIRMDSAFLDEDNFKEFDRLGIGFICTGKMYTGVKEFIGKQSKEIEWSKYDNGHQRWDYKEQGYKCDSWSRFYRAFYTRPVYEGEQALLEFARPENIIVTNVGVIPKVLNYCSDELKIELSSPERIIESHHKRGADELPHRGLKDFRTEEVPFKRFRPNEAFYYITLIAFFLLEAYKEDVLEGVIPIESYPSTVRRKVVDFAAKIVKTGGVIIVKVSQTIMDILKIETVWERCQNPIPILV